MHGDSAHFFADYLGDATPSTDAILQPRFQAATTSATLHGMDSEVTWSLERHEAGTSACNSMSRNAGASFGCA